MTTQKFKPYGVYYFSCRGNISYCCYICSTWLAMIYPSVLYVWQNRAWISNIFLTSNLYLQISASKLEFYLGGSTSASSISVPFFVQK